MSIIGTAFLLAPFLFQFFLVFDGDASVPVPLPLGDRVGAPSPTIKYKKKVTYGGEAPSPLV